ncbi:MAG: multicopper oxidase domain-containing protein [Chloroflexi bacterium]|nr:multicopper oxidase domain-containing protein [Chloroflexota bacterium]
MKQAVTSRRRFLLGILGAAGATIAARVADQGDSPSPQRQYGGGTSHDIHSGALFGTVGEVDHMRNGFHPSDILTDFNTGDRVYEEDGRTVREFDLVALDKEVEIAPGLFFPAWTYNGRIPGPTIRATEGDLVRVKFVNAGSHPHTIHFHGIHPAAMDGVPISAKMAGMSAKLTGPGHIQPGETFTYEFIAEPFGCHLYHCHAIPLKRHIHKGLYGAFIIDPKEGRPPAREMVMVMNAFDTNFDNENEVYAVNSIAFAYNNDPIPLKMNELVRIYLVNLTEFDLINSLHLHANFFDYYDHGTTLEPTLRRVDTVTQCQGQRGILEFQYRYPGMFMFHAHQSEFADLGWMGMFHVSEDGVAVIPDDEDGAAVKPAGEETTAHGDH